MAAGRGLVFLQGLASFGVKNREQVAYLYVVGKLLSFLGGELPLLISLGELLHAFLVSFRECDGKNLSGERRSEVAISAFKETSENSRFARVGLRCGSDCDVLVEHRMTIPLSEEFRERDGALEAREGRVRVESRLPFRRHQVAVV